MISFSGPVRLYFNRHALDGLVWIISNGLKHGSPEVAVRELVILGVTLHSRYEQLLVVEGPRRHDGPPSAWFEGEAKVEIGEDAIALITPA